MKQFLKILTVVLLLGGVMTTGLSGEVRAETNDKKSEEPDLETTLKWIENKLTSHPCISPYEDHKNLKQTCSYSISNRTLTFQVAFLYKERCTQTITNKFHLKYLQPFDMVKGKVSPRLYLRTRGDAIKQSASTTGKGCPKGWKEMRQESEKQNVPYLDELEFQFNSIEKAEKLKKAFNHVIKLLKQNPENQEDLF